MANQPSGNPFWDLRDDEEPFDAPNKSDIERFKRQAKANPANQNPDRVNNNTGPTSSPRSPSPRRGSSPRKPILHRSIGRRRGAPSRPKLTNPTGGRSPIEVGHSAAGIVLGAVVYALILSVVDYGSKGPGMWFEAKFLNNTTGSDGVNTGPLPNTKARQNAGLGPANPGFQGNI